MITPNEYYVPVTLSPSEIGMATHLAVSRQSVNRAAGVVDRMIGFRESIEIDIDGVLGEFAVCKYLNLYPDLTFERRSGGHDCIYQGLICDVKTRPFKKDQALQVPEHKADGDTEIFILTEVERTKIHILGFALRNDLFQAENLTPSVREGKFHYELSWSELIPIGDLHAHAIQKSQMVGHGSGSVMRDVRMYG
jgi:hypothetical protein